MMESPQVLDCLPNTPGIIHFDVAEPLSRRAGIKRDNRYTGALHLFDQTGFHFRGHDRDTFDLAVEKAIDTQLRAFRAVFGIGNDNFIVVLYGHALEGFHEVGKEWIRYVGDNESEDMTFA